MWLINVQVIPINDTNVGTTISVLFDHEELTPGRTYTARIQTFSNSLASPYLNISFTMSKTCVVAIITKKQIVNQIRWQHGLAVQRSGNRPYVTGSIHGWSRSHLTYFRVAADSKSASSLHSLPQLLLNFLFNTV